MRNSTKNRLVYKTLFKTTSIWMLIIVLLFSMPVFACAADTSSIPQEVLDARNYIVHVYLLLYDKNDNLVGYNSGAGIIGMGAVMNFGEDADSPDWKYVFTSSDCVNPFNTTAAYDHYRVVVLADGTLYEVEKWGVHPDYNHDLAVLYLNETIPGRVAAPLQCTNYPSPGDPVYAIGFPEPEDIYDPQFESFPNEEIIIPGNALGDNYEKAGVHYIPASMSVSRNLTGGALVDLKGNLVGMISSYRNGSSTYAIKADDLSEILMDFQVPVAYSADGLPTSLTDVHSGVREIAAGGVHTAMLDWEGHVSVKGDNKKGERNTVTWTDVVSIAAGIYTTYGIRSDGTVYATGLNKHGQCDTETWTNITKVSASDYHALGLKEDGSVVAAGLNAYKECNVKDWKDIVQIATGEYFSAGLRSDGTVITAGDNRWGQCNVSDWLVEAIDAGYWHTVGLLKNGKVIATGRNNYGQCKVSGWTDVVQISAGLGHTVALRSDGTVVAAGNNNYGQCDVSGWHDIRYVSAGMHHTIGIMEDGTILATGANGYGQCNISDWNQGA